MKQEQETQNGGGGMSRAAKKRAKKKEKRGPPTADPSIEEPQQPNNCETSEKPAAKRARLTHDSTEVVQRKDEPIVENRKGHSTDKASKPTKKSEPEMQEPILEPPIPSFPNAQLLDILLLRDPSDETSHENMEALKNLTSKERARCLFQAIIHPISVDEFYTEYWEKKPLFVPASQSNKNRYNKFLSLKTIREMSKRVPLYYGKDLNVTRYQKDAKDGVKRRITLDKSPRDEKESETGVLVNRSELWSNYDDKGCTIRLLCPHKHNDNIHVLLSTLELEFGCMIGANAYLTPPKSSQGFAPHWDDIEAFCLQLEGSKRWKVYEPDVELPRVSSEDFTSQDLKDKEPVIEVTAGPGDLLYMPRGWIHQACTLKDSGEHSLHLTVSVMQQWAWIDFLEMLMPSALDAAAMDEESAALRQGMPRGFLEYMGAMHDTSVDENLPASLKDDKDDEGETRFEKAKKRRQKALQDKFREEAKKKIMKVAKTACDMLDAACDQMGKRFLADRLPPALTKEERAGTSQNTRRLDKELWPATLCRLARPGIARLVLEDDKAIIYHCVDNSRVYQDKPLSPVEFETDDGPALEQLVTTVEPNWIRINDLFHDTIEDKIAIVHSLYDEGVLAILNEGKAEDEAEDASSDDDDEDDDDEDDVGF